MNPLWMDGVLTGCVITLTVILVALLAAHILRDEIGDSADSTLPRRDFTILPGALDANMRRNDSLDSPATTTDVGR